MLRCIVCGSFLMRSDLRWFGLSKARCCGTWGKRWTIHCGMSVKRRSSVVRDGERRFPLACFSRSLIVLGIGMDRDLNIMHESKFPTVAPQQHRCSFPSLHHWQTNQQRSLQRFKCISWSRDSHSGCGSYSL